MEKQHIYTSVVDVVLVVAIVRISVLSLKVAVTAEMYARTQKCTAMLNQTQ